MATTIYHNIYPHVFNLHDLRLRFHILKRTNKLTSMTRVFLLFDTTDQLIYHEGETDKQIQRRYPVFLAF